MASIFATFNTAKTGLTTHQSAITVTSHNIANSSTVGYSRQRVDITTTRPISLGGEAGQIGTGAQVAAIERVRDSFLDYQFRTENSELGKYSSKAEYLSQVEGIFNEPSDTGLSTMMSEFFDAFQELSKQSTSSSTRVVVAQKTQALCDTLNNTYTKLEKLKQDAQDSIKSSVKEINSILDQITTLNDQIRVVTLTGDQPNDLMDSRDALLDELSSKFGIDIEKTSFNGNDISATGIGSNLNPLVNSAPNGEVTRLSFVSSIVDNNDGTHTINYLVDGDGDKTQSITLSGLTDKEIADLESSRIILTNGSGEVINADGNVLVDGDSVAGVGITTFTPASGEIAGTIAVQSSIESYMSQLDNLAKGLALAVNAVHSGTIDASADDLPFFVNSTGGDESEISAKNISINKEILDNPMLINTKADADSGEGDGTRALAIAQLQSTLLNIQGVKDLDREGFLDGRLSADGMTIENDIANGTKIESYYQDIIDKLGVESQHAQRVVANEEELLTTLELNRLSVSGVSLDEEMSSLIQYQKAYSANAKVITTLSEMLDVIVGLI